METLKVENEDGICVVTLNRPEKLNALNAQCMKELDEFFTYAAADGEVKVVILTGAGEKAFVAGADIKGLTDLNKDSAEQDASSAIKL